MINTEKTTPAGFPEPEENKLSTEEMIHKIMDKTGVTKEQAQEALEKNNSDLLDAMIYVERTYGRASQAAQAAQTAQQAQTAQAAQQTYTQQAYTQPQQSYTAPQNTAAPGPDFSAAAKKAGSFITDNSFVIFYKGKEVVELPLIVAIAGLLLMFELTVPAAIIALFFDVTYRFRGPQLGRAKFNIALDAVAGMVRNIKASVMNSTNTQQ